MWRNKISLKKLATLDFQISETSTKPGTEEYCFHQTENLFPLAGMKNSIFFFFFFFLVLDGKTVFYQPGKQFLLLKFLFKSWLQSFFKNGFLQQENTVSPRPQRYISMPSQEKIVQLSILLVETVIEISKNPVFKK